jgi:hypothetical protein
MAAQTPRTHPRRAALLAGLLTVLALAVTAPSAGAAVSSASFDGTTATLNLDGADDNVTISASAGLLVHSAVGGGLESTADWDSSQEKEQTVPADGTVHVVVNGGDGNDTLVVLGSSSALAQATLNGDAGDDFLAGAETDDTLNGGDGNDTLVGRQGVDLMSGGAGDDTFVWNNGDGSDRQNGDAGNDTLEVNGSADLGDTFTLSPVPGGVQVLRTNLVPVKLDAATERIQINGLGGDDSVTAADGLGVPLSIDGGPGNDQVDIRDGTADIASGGDGTDTAVADAAGVDALDGFEQVDRPEVPAPPPPTTLPPAITPQPGDTPPALFLAPPNVAKPSLVTLVSRTARVRNGRASIKVRCPATAAGDCAGSLTLLTTKRMKLGSGRYDVRRGATATLILKLRRASNQPADRRGRLKVVALARASVAGAAAQNTNFLTLALRAPTKPNHRERQP